MKVAETYENEAWRVHRFAPAIQITEIRNAGKRGKKCRSISLYNLDFQKLSDAEQELLARSARKLAADCVSVETMQAWAESTGCLVQILDHRGVDTKKRGEEFTLTTPYVKLWANEREFSIEDLEDENNRSTVIQRGRADAKKIYRWLRENQDVVQGMRFRQIVAELMAKDLDFHQYCAMD